MSSRHDWKLVTSLTKKSDASFDPVAGRNVGVEENCNHVVRRVAGGGQCSFPLSCFVEGGFITVSFLKVD